MRTQKHDLKQEIKHLESQLRFAVINLDAFTQLSINKRLDEAKTLLFNIQ
tara:strand:+ start:977 stop:1126 length:150 start_codon:yes stop_codon:yes gene_type:complete